MRRGVIVLLCQSASYRSTVVLVDQHLFCIYPRARHAMATCSIFTESKTYVGNCTRFIIETQRRSCVAKGYILTFNNITVDRRRLSLF